MDDLDKDRKALPAFALAIVSDISAILLNTRFNSSRFSSNVFVIFSTFFVAELKMSLLSSKYKFIFSVISPKFVKLLLTL